MSAILLTLFVAVGQAEAPPVDTQKTLELKQKKLADALQAMAQLVSALEVAQLEVAKANQEVETAAANHLRFQAETRAARVEAQQRAVESIKSLIGASPKAVLPIPKKPPAKSIFDSKAPPPKIVPKIDPVTEIAAALNAASTKGTINRDGIEPKSYQMVEEEHDVPPASRSVAWAPGQEGWDYVWRGDKPLAGHPGGLKSVETWQFFVDGQWVKYSDLSVIPGGRAGWSRRGFAGHTILSQKGSSNQLWHDGKWHWVP